MNARDAIGEAIYTALYDVDADCPGVSVADAQSAADAVLAWLGDLDPDCSPELVSWHLRTNQSEIRLLKAILKRYDVCPIGLDDSPMICSAGTCSQPVCADGRFSRAIHAALNPERELVHAGAPSGESWPLPGGGFVVLARCGRIVAKLGAADAVTCDYCRG